MVEPLDIRDISIIDAFPVCDCPKTVLNVGCGGGRIDYHLSQIGYRVFATDIERNVVWEDSQTLTFHKADVFDLESFPVSSSPIVICAEVLEHLT